MSSNPPTPKQNPQDEQFSDNVLRPERFADYIGQDNFKKNLSILIGAAKARGGERERRRVRMRVRMRVDDSEEKDKSE